MPQMTQKKRRAKHRGFGGGGLKGEVAPPATHLAADFLWRGARSPPGGQGPPRGYLAQLEKGSWVARGARCADFGLSRLQQAAAAPPKYQR